MKRVQGSQSFPIAFLQWSVGIVVLIASLRLLVHSLLSLPATTVHEYIWFKILLSSAEIVGAALFLMPGKVRAGSSVLLAVFIVAAAFHLLHGEWDIGNLVVLIAAVVVVQSAS